MPTTKFEVTEKKQVSTAQVFILVSFVTVMISIVLALVFYRSMQPQIPLFYSLADQNKQLVNKEWIFLLPILGLAMAIGHGLILTLNRQYDEYLWRLFAVVTFVFELILLLINLRIIWLVF